MVEEQFHHRIQFIGRIPNQELNNYYAAANVSILPSVSEAFPLIPLESMACGTPVILSNRFSSNEIITDGENGFLVNVMNSSELAQQIALILSDQNRIEAMRSIAKTRIEQHFDIEKIIEEEVPTAIIVKLSKENK